MVVSHATQQIQLHISTNLGDSNILGEFRYIQQAMHTGMTLPESVPAFQQRYPRDDLMKFLTADPTLYDGLQVQFPITYGHCRAYVEGIMPRTNELAYIIENCLDTVSGLCRDAYSDYTFLLENKDEGSLNELRETIGMIVGKLAEIEPQAKEGHVRFTKFDAQQQSDTEALKSLLDRWKKYVPTHEVLDVQEQQTIQEARRTIDEALASLRSAEESEKAEKYRRNTADIAFTVAGLFNPFALLARHLVNPIGDAISTSPEEWKRRAESLNAQYENLVASEARRHAKFLSIELQLQTLSSSIVNLLDSLKPAVKAVQALSVAMSLLETEFKKVADRLEDIPQGTEIDGHSILHNKKDWEQLDKFGSDNNGVKHIREICSQLHQGTKLLSSST